MYRAEDDEEKSLAVVLKSVVSSDSMNSCDLHAISSEIFVNDAAMFSYTLLNA